MGEEKRYSSVGYVTWYKFFHYPDSIRPRISQFLILPPYRRQGHGSECLLHDNLISEGLSSSSSVFLAEQLYNTVFRDFVSNGKVADVAGERIHLVSALCVLIDL